MLDGETHHELLKFVDSTGVELLIMGSGHRTVFERFMIGSTAEAVISSSACDVLLVRPEGSPNGCGRIVIAMGFARCTARPRK